MAHTQAQAKKSDDEYSTKPQPGQLLGYGGTEEAERVELRVLKMRVQITPTVARLGTLAAQAPEPLFGAVVSLVKLVDRLNECIELDAAPGDPKGGERPDFSGLTCDCLRAKRAILCVAAKLACPLVAASKWQEAWVVVENGLATVSDAKALDKLAELC